MPSKKKKLYDLDFFLGGVPAGAIFSLEVEQIVKGMKVLHKKEIYYQTFLELGFIGLVSYFEAFCKGHFVSIINICPNLHRRTCY